MPHHRELQRRILLEMLGLVYAAGQSGEIRQPEITWAEARREGVRIERELRPGR